MKDSAQWTKAALPLEALGQRLKLWVPHDVFSTLRIDEGTLLLLDHLPEREPQSVLDLGCGYGALGLPIAARYPRALVHLVDRDLLAVRASNQNALTHHLSNVCAYGSLGYRDLREKSFDWILCNVPARIGTPFIEDLLLQGLTRLNLGGELRVVVIRDLSPVLEEIRARLLPDLDLIASGARHCVFRLKASQTPPKYLAPDSLYLRDQVCVQEQVLQRPFDLGGDDPLRMRAGLPALWDSIPRAETPERLLTFRAYYGALHALAWSRFGEAKVPIVSVERDLLACEFQKRNAGVHPLEVRQSVDLLDALKENERFSLVIGELSASAGERVLGAELSASKQSLKKGGQALFLVLEKVARDWAIPEAQRQRLEIQTLLAREGYSVLRLRA
jgi:16S rRNA (guanine1207-N2)-methyltransferase